VLVVNNGNFGGRWVKMSRAFGLEVTELKYDWGVKADNVSLDLDTMHGSRLEAVKGLLCRAVRRCCQRCRRREAGAKNVQCA